MASPNSSDAMIVGAIMVFQKKNRATPSSRKMDNLYAKTLATKKAEMIF